MIMRIINMTKISIFAGNLVNYIKALGFWGVWS